MIFSFTSSLPRLVILASLSTAAIGCAAGPEDAEDIENAPIDATAFELETSQTREHILLATAPRQSGSRSPSTELSAGKPRPTHACVEKNVGGHVVLECTECTGPGGTNCVTKICDPYSGKCT